MTKLFTGVATALATPMTPNGGIDYDSYRRLVNFQIDAGINALIVAGTTGEGSTLSSEEKLELLKITLELRGTRDIPVILGTGSNNTLTAIENTRLAKENGADAALIVTPYYNKTSQEGLLAHYYAIADSVDIPIILYNVPGRTGLNILADTVVKLADHRNIVGLKDATGSMPYLDSVINNLNDRENFALYSGDDGSFFDFLAHGGDGVISVVTNCTPKSFLREYNLFIQGDISGARKLQQTLNPFICSLFADVSPTPVKAVLNTMGYAGENFRLPLIATNDTVRQRVIRTYEEVKGLED